MNKINMYRNDKLYHKVIRAPKENLPMLFCYIIILIKQKKLICLFILMYNYIMCYENPLFDKLNFGVQTTQKVNI